METSESVKLDIIKKQQGLLDKSPRGSEVNLVSNYIKMNFRPASGTIYVYSIAAMPEIAADNENLLRNVLRTAGRNIAEQLHPYIVSGTNIYSTQNKETFFINTTYGHGDTTTEYQLKISNSKSKFDLKDINNYSNESIRSKNFVEIVIKNIMYANSNLVKFNKRNYFDINNSTLLNNGNSI